MTPYRDGREHLFDELRRLDLLLNVQVVRLRREPTHVGYDEFRGLFISEAEIDTLLGRKSAVGESPSSGDDPDEGRFLATLAAAEDAIARRTSLSVKAGVPLPLLRLAQLFDLAPFDVDVLLVCLAPELDLKYEKLYAYLQNDVTRKWPSVDLVLGLLCRSLDEKLRAREHLAPVAPLVRRQLVVFPGDSRSAGHGDGAAWLARPLRIDRRILDYLLADGAAPAAATQPVRDLDLAPFCRLVTPRAALEEALLPAGSHETLAGICRAAGIGRRPSVLLFYGPAAAGKKFAAEALCRAAGIDLLVADLPQLLAREDVPRLAQRVLREARLVASAVYLDHGEALLGEGERAVEARRAILEAIPEFPGLVFIASEQAWPAGIDPAAASFVKVALPVPPYATRLRLWQTFLAGVQAEADLDLEGLADKFSFTPGRIRDAVAEAQHLARLQDGEAATLSRANLYAASRMQSSPRLASLARKITPVYRWEDIVLPPDSLRHLREICDHMRHRQQVFETWGFNRKLALGKGLSILFVGPSGTGKTMAAEIMAGELGLELYKIDLSTMISKYIGETEKNLAQVFREGEQSNAILFFDEADAVFGKRSEVKDSHDRYANIEINYLLQRMEEYEGVVVLASNFQKNIDEAFTRRMRFIVEFPFPDERYRRGIWQSVYPHDTPLDPDIDYAFMARQFKIPGGSIKNIALGAAFLAAADGRVITMEHLILATKREFQKTGRLCVKSDFERYFELVGGDEVIS